MFSNIKKNKNQKGFTLLDSVIAIAIVSIGILSILALSKQSELIIYDARDKLTASYLAKEGMEVARNRRDQNLLREGVAWNEGIENTGLRYLKINTDGLYNYTIGDLTKFRRETIISLLSPNKLRVEVRVEWRNRSFEIIENLYNWR